MPTKSTSKTKTSTTGQLLLRYRGSDTIAGVSRRTVTRVAKTLGLTETQAIHLALARLAKETLPRYEADSGPLSTAQLRAINRLEPQGRMRTDEKLFT